MRAAFTAALLGATTVLANDAHHQLSARLATDKQPIIVQLFEWNWDAVKAECATIGQLGYTYVQVSPAAEHITGNTWWSSYQRVSSQLTSKRGNRDQFASMVDTCKNAGVGVLVDVVLNHMTAGSGTGVAGTGFTQYTYTGLYSGFDFHYCGSKNRGINNWGNKTEIQNCQLSGLADLKTESTYVQDTLVNHLNDLLSFPGVSGFRIDAAKHIPVDHLRAIVRRLSRNPYITSEVVGEGAPIPPSDYTSLGSVVISKSYEVVKKAFNAQTALSSLKNWESNNGVHTGSATVFVATHDSERGNVGGSLVPASTQAYTLANVFMLAYPYGTPSVLSSYKFKTADDGAPANGAAQCTGTSTTAANGWWCQHRWAGVAAMAKFRTSVGTAALDNWVNGNQNQVAFGRKGKGHVAINNDKAVWTITLTTSLPNGSYCDVVAGAKTGSSCTGAKATVTGGKMTVRVPAKSAVAFYSESKL